jgi:hypothetical protein
MMEQVTRQTESHSTEPASHTTARIVGVIFAVFEIILGFRLVFKLLGANPDNGFVNVIYSITKPVVGIFSGIFSKVVTEGSNFEATFEPETLITMIVVALIDWVILKLATRSSGNRLEKTETTQHDTK